MESETAKRSPIGLIFTLLIALGLGGVAAYFYTENAKLIASLEEKAGRIATQAIEMADLETAHEDAIATLEKNFLNEVEEINNEWNRQLEEERRNQQEKLGRIYEEVNKIVYSSEDALDYIDAIEAKLEEGQELTKADIERLEMLGAGLTYVQKQYSKPIEEFKELETFLASQLGAQLIPPKERYNFFQRIFGREYRQAVREFHKDEGRREAFSVAREKVSVAYTSAQQQMAALASDTDKYIEDIQAIISGNKNRAEDLEDFFENSRKVIDIHQSIMRLETQQEESQAEQEPLEDEPKS
jgi:uncharacterized protein YukE